jgi:hypothetical protein
MDAAAEALTSSAAPRTEAQRVASAPTAMATAAAPSIAIESTEHVTPLRMPPAAVPGESSDTGPRFTERAVALPVTRLSDARPRESTPAHIAGDRPVMQLLTLGLLIAMVVLVSAAVGVLVGRWMSQH